MTDDLFERTPPHDLHAEQCVLGGMMLSPDAIGSVASTLTAEDFYRPAHQLIFSAALTLHDRSEPVDPVTVLGELTKANHQGRMGGAPYLLTLTQGVPVAASAGYYAKIVKERALQRSLEAAALRIAQVAREGSLDSSERIDSAWRALESAADGIQNDSTAEAIEDLLPGYLDYLERDDATECVATGWTDLDALLSGGLRPGQLVVVGARPAVGKSIVLLNIATHVAMNGGTSLFESLEMSKNEIIERIISKQGRVALHALRSKTMNDDDWANISKAADTIAATKQNLVIDDQAHITIAYMRAQLRAMVHAGRPATILFVDYLQLMSSGQRVESRQVEVAQFSRGLKLLAKEFHIPVVVAAQLNRGLEHRADKKPGMADLRESGAIEQDADIVILLHREDAIDKESPRAGEMDLIVAKHRNGPTSIVTCAFQGHYSRVVDMAKEPDGYPSYRRGAA